MSTDFGILGALQVVRDGRSADLGSPRQRTLLARLLIARATVSADRLIDDLWAADAPDTARHALHVYVSRVRRALGADGDRLERHGSSYRFRIEPAELDAARFEQALKKGREIRTQGDPEVARVSLREALELWRGPVLAEFADEPWARDEIARLEELRLSALEDRIWADLECGSAGELVEELEGLASEHPFREVYAEQLMLALYRSGRQADALRAYQTQRTRLSEELGIDPGPALERIQERILAQDPALDEGEAEPASRTTASLPLQRTSFIGREHEASEAAQLLARCRLLTLTGPPGTGKTRLGLRLVEDADGFPEGKVFVSLAPVTDATLLGSAVAGAIGLRETVGEPVLDVVKAYLLDKRLLLLVDNFEHLADAAPVVGELLDAAPDLKVVVTSRAPLGIAGEQEFGVPPLEAPPATVKGTGQLGSYDAVALFAARARAIDPSFEVDDSNASAVAAVTRRLDGLPLAIELAAARVRLYSPADLLERLERRLDVFAAGPTDVEERHRTMRAAVAWSHELLEPAEQMLFRRLGVFRGGFTLAAAAAVAGCSDEEVEAGVESLLAKSLLYRPVSAGQARFAMLETMRTFALENLRSTGEDAATTEGHTRFYERLASTTEPELTGEDPGSAVDRLAVEIDNLRAALDHALSTGATDTGMTLASAIWRFWQSTGQLPEGRLWLDRMLALEGASPPTRAKGLDARAGLAYWAGDFEAAHHDYAEVLELHQATGDREGEANALYCLSLLASFEDHADEAERLAHDARLMFEELGLQAQVAQALMAEGTAVWKKGDLARARQIHEEGLEANLASDDLAAASSELVGMGGIAFQQGEVEQALDDVSRALEMAVGTENAHTQLFAIDSLASFVAAREPIVATTLAGAAEALRHEHGGGWTLASFGVEDARTLASGALTDDELERAWAEGSEMSLEQAVELGRRLLS